MTSALSFGEGFCENWPCSAFGDDDDVDDVDDVDEDEEGEEEVLVEEGPAVEDEPGYGMPFSSKYFGSTSGFQNGKRHSCLVDQSL